MMWIIVYMFAGFGYGLKCLTDYTVQFRYVLFHAALWPVVVVFEFYLFLWEVKRRNKIRRLMVNIKKAIRKI